MSNHEDQTASRLEEWDRNHVWHSFTQMQHYQPFIVESARGCRLKDIHGNEFIDGVSSLWCNVHGHRHPVLDDALRQQIDLVSHVTNLGGSHCTTIRLARKLVEITPAELDHVFFCSDGANAIEVALKMAFQYWQQCETPQPQRTKYVALSDAYHGDTIGTVSIGDVPLFHQLFKPLLFEPIRFNAPNAYDPVESGPGPSSLQKSLDELEELLVQHSHQIAAIIAEPLIQGAAGIKIHPEGFLRGIADLAKKHDILLVADEVAVGFGRTGKLFACEHEQVVPDILCLGKGLSGGYLPISATLASNRIYEAFLGDYDQRKTLFHGHTFAGNPLAAAVSLASLGLFESEQTLEKLEPKIEIIKSRVAALAKYKNAKSPRSLGIVAAFDLEVPAGQNETEFGYRFCSEVQNRGVRLRPLGRTVIIMPPLVIEENELNMIFDAIESTLGAFNGQ